MTISVFLLVIIIDVMLLSAAIFHFWISKRVRRFAVPIIKTGIAPKGSGFYGQPYEDMKVHRVIGYAYLYGVIYGYLAGWILLLMMPILSVLLIYIDLFIVISN